MSVETDADRLAMLADFGVTSTWNAASQTVIFDDKFQIVDTQGVPVESADPQVVGRASDFVGVKDGDAITVNAVSYKVRRPMPDGTGFIVMTLSK